MEGAALRLVCWLCAALACAAPLAAQNPRADSLKASREALFVPVDALYAGGFLLGGLAMYPIDLKVAEEIAAPSGQTNDLLRGTATAFRVLGNPTPALLSGGLFLAGRLTGRPEMADVGLHTGESLAMAIALTVTLKSVAGRARPDEDPDHPHDFALGRGWQDDRYQSFPSGHTSSAFATAAALSTEIGRLYPDSRGWVKPLLYGSAGLVGVSRIYNNRHWASDVVTGAAIGTFSGWKVVRYNHTHPANWVDRLFLTGDGVVSWAF
jgi:membrane-associated phospholipid phosphatase